jgi:hypothetical protein
MRVSNRLRAAFIVIAVAFAATATQARADSGYVRFSVLKGGWFIGASAGSGVLYFRGRAYPLSIGGISGGFVFGGSHTNFQGRVSNIRSPYDVAGVYAAAGAGGTFGVGGQVIVLQNEKGAVLTLSGLQIGLQVNADLSGMSVSLR